MLPEPLACGGVSVSASAMAFGAGGLGFESAGGAGDAVRGVEDEESRPPKPRPRPRFDHLLFGWAALSSESDLSSFEPMTGVASLPLRSESRYSARVATSSDVTGRVESEEMEGRWTSWEP